jgi:hypothetical protein
VNSPDSSSCGEHRLPDRFPLCARRSTSARTPMRPAPPPSGVRRSGRRDPSLMARLHSRKPQLCKEPSCARNSALCCDLGLCW